MQAMADMSFPTDQRTTFSDSGLGIMCGITGLLMRVSHCI